MGKTLRAVEGGPEPENGNYSEGLGFAIRTDPSAGVGSPRASKAYITPEEAIEDRPYITKLLVELEIISRVELSEEDAQDYADRILAGEHGNHLPVMTYEFV